MIKAKLHSEKYSDKLKTFLLGPAAIGIYITLTLAFIASEYYSERESLKQMTGSFKIINDIDQKSIDYRLHLRGARKASNNIAVLAVDDDSIDSVGRWPWPRGTLARALENAFKAGAKVIAADVVWSEPSDRPEKRFADQLIRSNEFTKSAKDNIQKKILDSDPDQKFAEFVKKYKSQFVIGNFYNSFTSLKDTDSDSGYQTSCHDLIFKNDPLTQITTKQSSNFAVLDSKESLWPELFAEGYSAKLNDLESEERSHHPTPTDTFAQYKIDQSILEAKINFCRNTFLNTQYDDIAQNIQTHWQELKTADNTLTFDSFDEWYSNYKSNNMLNAIPETLYWTLTIPEISNQGEHFGFFNAELESDGTIRKTQLISRTGSYYMPSIALQAYFIATDFHGEIKIDSEDQIKHPGAKGIKYFKVVNADGETQFSIPTNFEGKMLINYAGPRNTIPHASIADLLNEDDPYIKISYKAESTSHVWADEVKKVLKKDFFKDKILVLGATAIGVFDLRVTPFDENYPGVETHANVIDNLVRKDFLYTDAVEEHYMPLAILALGVFLSFALAYAGALWGLGISLITAFIIAYIDKTFLFSQGKVVSIVLPLFQVGFSYMCLTFYKYLTEERNKKELRATFSKYVSPAIVEEVLRHPKNLELGGRKEKVTVFFSDVRGFTTISEKLDPRALSDLLNSYLTPMTDLIFKNKGTLDKYMGDAIMAFFGAPVHYEDHAKMACSCALQNMAKLQELKVEYARKNLPPIDIGIGLNTGEVSVGNMGSESVRSYTVMGDAVNLASRLEGINKSYGTHIIISEFTQKEVAADFTTREVDLVRVKGKLQPIRIFELLSECRPIAQIQENLKIFEEAYQLYHSKKFEKAKETFEKALRKYELDETSKIYIERCQDLIINPPPPDWDGVFVMKTK